MTCASDDPNVVAKAQKQLSAINRSSGKKFEMRMQKTFDEFGQQTGEEPVLFDTQTGEILGNQTAPKQESAPVDHSQYVGRAATKGGQPVPDGTEATAGGVRLVVRNGVWELAK